MKAYRSKEIQSRAFTLVELLVIVAILGLLSCLVLPALARAKPKSITAQCMSNKKQVQLAASMYASDNNDSLVGNTKGSQQGGWISAVPQATDWFTSDANTNPTFYRQSLLGAYLGENIKAYRCPGDNLPSQNGPRIRSISMNGQVGETDDAAHNDNPTYRTYLKSSDFHDASRIWVFCDESIWTMNDGWLELKLTGAPNLPDVPAAYHDNGNCFSFEDGHAAFQKWVGVATISPTAPAGILGVVYQTGVSRPGSYVTPTRATDPDYLWLQFHTGELK